MIGCILSVFGWYYILRGLYALYRIVEEIFLLKELDLPKRYGEASWAFITGSTDGIGFGFAQQLAKRGFNIVLVGRDPQKLAKKEAELKEQHPKVQVKRVQVDFSQAYDTSKLQEVLNQVADLDISILVNNVGVSMKDIHLFMLDRPKEESLNMVTVNCIPQAVFSKVFAERFQKRKNRSAILTVSSLACSNPNVQEDYSATKVFNRQLSLALGEANLGSIDFLVVKPGYVSTKMTAFKPVDKLMVASVEEHVCGSLKVLGQKPESYGCAKHIIFSTLISVFSNLPAKVQRKGAEKNLKAERERLEADKKDK